MWWAECDIADLADSPVLGQSTYLEDVNVCITSSLELDGLSRAPKLLIGVGAIVNPPQLLATLPLALTMPRHRFVARSDEESNPKRMIFITLQPTLDIFPDDNGVPHPYVSTAAQELLKHPSKDMVE